MLCVLITGGAGKDFGIKPKCMTVRYTGYHMYYLIQKTMQIVIHILLLWTLVASTQAVHMLVKLMNYLSSSAGVLKDGSISCLDMTKSLHMVIRKEIMLQFQL